MTAALRIARNSAYVGYAEVLASYTWKSWLFGWLTRVAAQILFFTAMGLLVGGDDLIEYAFIGNIVAMAALMPLGTGADTAWERGLGTLPLLVAAPRSMLPVFAGRSSFYIVQGLGESLVIYALLAPVLGISKDWWWLPAGVAAVVLGAYGLGLFIASLAIRKPRAGNTTFNLVFYTAVAIGGVNVPTAVFPGWVQSLADVLPLHHGLLGLRALLDGDAGMEAFRQLGIEVVVGTFWFVLALAGFRWFAEGGRRDGSIDLVE